MCNKSLYWISFRFFFVSLQNAFVQCKSFFFLSLSSQTWQSIQSVYFITIWCIYIFITIGYIYISQKYCLHSLWTWIWTGVGHTLGNQSALKYISLVFSLIYCVLLFFTKVLHSCQWLILQQCIAAMLLYWWCPKFTLVSVRAYSCSCGWTEQIFIAYV